MLELIKDLGTAINSLVFLILVFKYLNDLKRFGLEHEKLTMEVQRLRKEAEARPNLVAAPTPDDIRTLVTDPVIREIRRASDEWNGTISHLSSAAVSDQVYRLDPLLHEILKTLQRIEKQMQTSSPANQRDETGDALATSGEQVR